MKTYLNGIPSVRCDGCSAISSGDDFDSFMCSWPVGFAHSSIAKVSTAGVSDGTSLDDVISRQRMMRSSPSGEPVMRFIYERHNPQTPALLHTCQGCAKKIRHALKKNKLNLLPEGPLKKILLLTIANPENKFAAFQLHFYKDSKMGTVEIA